MSVHIAFSKQCCISSILSVRRAMCPNNSQNPPRAPRPTFVDFEAQYCFLCFCCYGVRNISKVHVHVSEAKRWNQLDVLTMWAFLMQRDIRVELNMSTGYQEFDFQGTAFQEHRTYKTAWWQAHDKVTTITNALSPRTFRKTCDSQDVSVRHVQSARGFLLTGRSWVRNSY